MKKRILVEICGFFSFVSYHKGEKSGTFKFLELLKDSNEWTKVVACNFKIIYNYVYTNKQ